MAIPVSDVCCDLLELFSEVSDGRSDQGRDHPVAVVLALAAAIRAARPGDRILVRPGLYRESVVLDKPLEIIGQGPIEEIVIQAQDTHVLLFRTDIGRVANLTLRQLGGKEVWYGVDIHQGRLELEGCDITSRSGACVAIHNGADPRLRRNRIHDGKESGVFVYKNGLGTLEEVLGISRRTVVTRSVAPATRKVDLGPPRWSGSVPKMAKPNPVAQLSE